MIIARMMGFAMLSLLLLVALLRGAALALEEWIRGLDKVFVFLLCFMIIYYHIIGLVVR